MSAEDKKKLNPGSKLGGMGKYSKGNAADGGSKGCCWQRIRKLELMSDILTIVRE